MAEGRRESDIDLFFSSFKSTVGSIERRRCPFSCVNERRRWEVLWKMQRHYASVCQPRLY